MNNYRYNQIDDFIKGRMSQQEASSFRDKIDNDPDLAKDYKILKGLHEVLDKKDQLEFLDTINIASYNYDQRHKDDLSRTYRFKINTRHIPWLSAAAILLSFAIYILLSTMEKSPQNTLFKKHYAQYKHIIEIRDAGDSTSTLYSGMQHFKTGSYEKALTSFLEVKEKYNQISTFYIGLCYMELEYYDKAIIYLKEATETNSEQKQDAEWYLALAYLAEGKEKDSEKMLERIIINPRHFYHNQAQNLLAELK